MGGARRCAVVVATVLAAVLAAVVPAAEGARAAPGATGAPADRRSITMTELFGPDGEPLVGAVQINERGQVVGLMRDDDPAGLATVVWEQGRTTRVTPEGASALPTAISERGQVVGVVIDGPLPWACNHTTVWPFSWSDGELTRLTPEGVEGAASDIDARGLVLGYREVGPGGEAVAWDAGETIVGPASAPLIPSDDDRPHLNSRGQATLRIPAGGGFHAAVWQVGGRVTDLGTFGGPSSRAAAINNRGWVVGNADTPEGGPHAFLWRRGRMLDLGRGSPDASFAVDVNDRGQVLVNGNPAGGGAYLWENGRKTDLGDLGGDYIGAVALNERGQVIGHGETAEGDVHAFLWERGRMTDLGALAGDVGSEVTDLNERGQVIGRLTPESGSPVPVLWTVQPGR
jgi:probable HAF family extracellular repeat protein